MDYSYLVVALSGMLALQVHTPIPNLNILWYISTLPCLLFLFTMLSPWTGKCDGLIAFALDDTYVCSFVQR